MKLNIIFLDLQAGSDPWIYFTHYSKPHFFPSDLKIDLLTLVLTAVRSCLCFY